MALQMTGSRLLRTDETAAVAAARAVWKAAKMKGLDVGVTFVLDVEMRALNRHWRKKDKTTDVLSFSAFEGEFVIGDETFLGDLVISVETAAKQARAQNHGIDVEIAVLVCHGLCHLAGLDHERGELEAEKQLMIEMNWLSCAGVPVSAALAGRA